MRESGVDLVIDVRSIPRSRTNPQFNQETLPGTLKPWQIGYEHIAELRGPPREPARRRAFVKCLLAGARFSGLRTMLRRPFGAGLARLRERGADQRCVVMCAEAVRWRAPPDHRRLPYGRRRASDAHSREIACRRGELDTRCRRTQRSNGGLSRRGPAMKSKLDAVCSELAGYAASGNNGPRRIDEKSEVSYRAAPKSD